MNPDQGIDLARGKNSTGEINMASKFKYRCKFLCAGIKTTPQDFNLWAANPPDGGLPLCPAAYDNCHSPCDLLQTGKGMRYEDMIEKVEGAG